jgi:hypothetical protein
MAKVKIQGNASGTGVITLIAPATDTDRTVTLPDESITLAGGVDGIVSTANATAITIDSSEQVGIGQTNPSAQLHLKQTSGDQFLKMEGATTNWGWRNQSDGTYGLFDFTNSRWLYLGNNSYVSFQPGGTEKFKITSDGRGLSQFTAKAWINFDGTGTVSIRDSHNVSSIEDADVGQYKINFSNSLGNAYYSFVYCGGDTGGAETTFQNRSTPSSSQHRVQLKNAAGTVTDRPYITGTYFGD